MKKTIIALLIVSMSAGLFAQTSKTASVTNSLFKTNVDFFMNVNNFGKVKPENAFLYLGYNGDSFDLGVAKQFKPFYLGLFFDGRLNNFTSTTTTSGSNGTTTNTYTDANTAPVNGWKFDTLLGFNNFGLKYSFWIDDNSVYNPSHTASTSDYNNKVNFQMKNALSFGLNATAGKASLTPNVTVGLNTTAKQDDVLTNGNRVLTDNSVNTIVINAASGIGFEKKNNLKNDFNVGLDTAFDLFPATTNINGTVAATQAGKFDNDINLTLGYTLTYFATDKFTLKGKVSATASTNFHGDTTSTTVNGTTTDVDPVVTSNSLKISPSFVIGAQYLVKPEFILNFGLAFSTVQSSTYGLCNWSTTTSTPKSGDVTTTTTYNFQPGNMHITWASGFDWKVAKVLDLDFSWEILPNLMGASDTLDINKSGNFWDVVGGIVFNRISFGISAKF